MYQVIQHPDQHYYLTKLIGYDYDISYKPRKENSVLDSLRGVRRLCHNI